MNALWSPPNLLSLSRVVQAVVLWFLPVTPAWLAVQMALAGASDLLDGWWARRLRARDPDSGHAARVEEMGAWLDPVCDKVFMLSVVAVLYAEHILDARTLAILSVREWVMFPLWVASRVLPGLRDVKLPYRALPMGKAATVAQFIAVVLLVVSPSHATPWVWLAGVLSLLAVVTYAHRAFNVRAAARG